MQRCSYVGHEEVNYPYHTKQWGLIHMAHEAGAEVYPSIGSWMLSNNFPRLNANPVVRVALARQCVKALAYHDFNGIDIHWEYPRYTDHSWVPRWTQRITAHVAEW